MCGSDIFLGLIAILFPPLAVWVKRGICGADSLINIALCCLGFLPGLLHAWYIIAVTPEPTYEELQDAEQGRVTYYYVTPAQAAPPPRGYGAVNSATPSAQFASSSGQPQPQQQQQPGSASEVPPTYQQAVQGDHKVQGP